MTFLYIYYYLTVKNFFQQPGKLNLKNFSVVTEAIARMNVSGKDSRNTNFGNAPLATPEVVDLGSEYAQVKDMVHNMYPDAEYMYTLVQDAVSGKSKLRQRREKGQPCMLCIQGVHRNVP